MRSNSRTFSDRFVISSKEELESTIEEFGFVPFFANPITGFSLEEHIAPKCWWAGEDPWPAWEWKGPVIRETGCAYGKFMQNKAVYISREWFPDFANYRRDGYDADARYDDGLMARDDKLLFDLLDSNAPICSKTLKKLGDYRKGGRKGFDSSITRLQKNCYVVITDFKHETDKNGNEYGWGIGEYSTPEKFFGRDFTDRVYKRSPEESRERVKKHLMEILPKADEKAIDKMLG